MIVLKDVENANSVVELHWSPGVSLKETKEEVGVHVCHVQRFCHFHSIFKDCVADDRRVLVCANCGQLHDEVAKDEQSKAKRRYAARKCLVLAASLKLQAERRAKLIKAS